MRRKTIGVAVLAISVIAGAVAAGHMAVTDGTERGRLDVRRVVQTGGTYAKWKVTTYQKWSRRQILDQGFVSVYLDTFGNERHDYYALIWADKSKIRATLFRDRKNKVDAAVRSLRVSRPNQRSVKVVVPLNKLRIGDNRATYNWYVQSLWSGAGCKRVCFDWAPDLGKNGGGIEEPLPLSL